MLANIFICMLFPPHWLVSKYILLVSFSNSEPHKSIFDSSSFCTTLLLRLYTLSMFFLLESASHAVELVCGYLGAIKYSLLLNARMRKLKESISNILTLHKKNKYSDDLPPEELTKEEEIELAKPKKKKPMSLPHWCVYIAWVCK